MKENEEKMTRKNPVISQQQNKHKQNKMLHPKLPNSNVPLSNPKVHPRTVLPPLFVLCRVVDLDADVVVVDEDVVERTLALTGHIAMPGQQLYCRAQQDGRRPVVRSRDKSRAL